LDAAAALACLPRGAVPIYKVRDINFNSDDTDIGGMISLTSFQETFNLGHAPGSISFDHSAQGFQPLLVFLDIHQKLRAKAFSLHFSKFFHLTKSRFAKLRSGMWYVAFPKIYSFMMVIASIGRGTVGICAHDYIYRTEVYSIMIVDDVLLAYSLGWQCGPY
jgi:hypothetical protein